MWWWILIWSLLALGAVATSVLLGWRLLRKVVALGHELARSAEQVSQAMATPATAYQPASSVLADPSSAPADRVVG